MEQGLPVPTDLAASIANKWIIKENMKGKNNGQT
jgi:hypothetical protein